METFPIRLAASLGLNITMHYTKSIILTLYESFPLFLINSSFIFNCQLFADADVRLARRIRRDTVERGRDINSVLEQVLPTIFSVTIV